MAKRTIDKDVAIDVDHYLASQCMPQGDPFQYILDYSKSQGLPVIHVAPLQGKMLKLYVQMMNASQVLEIGTLAGYSTAWLASGLSENGQVHSIDLDESHLNVADHGLKTVGLRDRVQLYHGDALDVLEDMHASGLVFDFIFIDADKERNPLYLQYALKLARSGTIIVADNVVRNGKVILGTSKARNIIGLREFFNEISHAPNLSATAVQTLTTRGWDGYALIRVD